MFFRRRRRVMRRRGAGCLLGIILLFLLIFVLLRGLRLRAQEPAANDGTVAVTLLDTSYPTLFPE